MTYKTSETDPEPIFLAITAAEKYWNEEQFARIYLGPWCLRHSRREVWGSHPFVVCSDHWEDNDRFINDYTYLRTVYEQKIESLSNYLNHLHGLHYSRRFWKILLGGWLIHYLDIMYDRYISLQSAMQRYPNFVTYGMTNTSYVTPVDLYDFGILTENEADMYNIQIFTRILEVMGPQHIGKLIPGDIRDPVREQRLMTPKKQKKTEIRAIMNRFTRLLGKRIKVILYNSYWRQDVIKRLMLSTKGRIWPFFPQRIEISPVSNDSGKRNQYEAFGIANSEFEVLLDKMLPLDIPQCFIENFREIGRYAINTYPSNPKVIYTATSYYFDEFFKQWAAVSVENGAKLVGGQHGGNYGSLAQMAALDFELGIVDQYMSWGWIGNGQEKNIIPSLCCKAKGQAKQKIDSDQKKVLLVSGAATRYLNRITSRPLPYNFEEYTNWQLRFIAALMPIVRENFRVRNYLRDYGWERAERWKEKFPDLWIEDPHNRPFNESLNDCALFIADQLSTTFVEALIANKPTILFWKKDYYILRKEAQGYYDELARAGILYYDPEKAAEAVRVAYEDVDIWWNEPARQKARELFCGYFARTSPHEAEELMEKLGSLI